MSNINFYLLEYAKNYILRHKNKNIFIVIVFTLLVALLCTLFFVSTTVEYEMESRLENQPDIVVQNYKAGRLSTIKSGMVDKLLEIDGVSWATQRVYGKYRFSKEGASLNLVGVDPFEEQENPFIAKLLEKNQLNENDIFVSQHVKELMHKAYYDDYFNFIKPDGKLLRLNIAKSFDVGDRKYLEDLVLVNKDKLREIFGYKADEGSDIALGVANKNELAFIRTKIALMLPNAKVTSKDDLKVAYKNLFNYDSGVFLSVFIVAIFTFFIIIYDKANGLSSEEKREIGILKAVGWRVEDVLHAKFYEAFIISFFSFFVGFLLAFIYVFVLKAPYIGDIFMHDQLFDIKNFNLNVHLEFSYILLIFLLSVPVYIAATLIPSWRVATLDADEVMR